MIHHILIIISYALIKNLFLVSSSDVPAPTREAGLKDSQRGVAEEGEQEEHDDDLDDESIFTCDNCQQDFDCLAELSEHRTNHCPAGETAPGSGSGFNAALPVWRGD